MAREFEYDSFSGGTLPPIGAAGERYADPTVADATPRTELDATAYTLPAGDPFGDALAEQFTEPARIEPVPIPRVQQPPPPPPTDQAQQQASAPRREQRRPSRPAPPPQRRSQQQPQRQQPQRTPALTQSKPPPVNPLTIDELTKRPPLRKQLPPTRTKPKQSRGSAMARFPTNPGRAPHPAESAVPPRRAKTVRPIWPIIIFLVILVALVRGCVDSTHHDGSLAPTHSAISMSSLQQ